MKSNNKGFTLIESIVTAAIITVVFGCIALSFRYITHFMLESSQIKQTSNEIFSDIQNDTNIVEEESSIIFNTDITINGTNKIVTKEYNDKDDLSLYVFSGSRVPEGGGGTDPDNPDGGEEKPDLGNPILIEEIDLYLAYYWNLKDSEINNGNGNVLNNEFYRVIDFPISIYDKSHIYLLNNNEEISDISNINNSFADSSSINMGIINNQAWTGILKENKSHSKHPYQSQNQYASGMYDLSEIEVVFYKAFCKNHQHGYRLFGFVKPKGTIITTFELPNGKTFIYFVDPNVGFTNNQFSDLGNNSDWISGNVYWQSPDINNGKELDIQNITNWNGNIFENVSTNTIVEFKVSRFK